MDGSIRLSSSDRKVLLQVYRSGTGSLSRRTQIVLLSADGYSVRDVRRFTYSSFALIIEVLRDYRQHGLAALTATASPPAVPSWAMHVVDWLTTKTPEDFGYFRRRWSCETLAEVLAWEVGVRVSAETVRRALRRLGFVWRRPRPVVGPVDPERATKLKAIQDLLRNLPDNETAVFQDEVDVHLNPKIGSCWMRRGEQAEVPTPGNNQKRHLAGSLVWRTGTLVVSPPGFRRNAELFVDHLEDLRCRFRHARKIHVICDNASFHRSRLVREYLQRWNHRVAVHHLPKYAPETNPIERVWWQLHETLTRNHRCATLEELIGDIYDWIEAKKSFYHQELSHYTNAA
jgi:transposase